MTTAEANIQYCIDKATENIAKARKLGLTNLAQQIRRERRALIAQLPSEVNA